MTKPNANFELPQGRIPRTHVQAPGPAVKASDLQKHPDADEAEDPGLETESETNASDSSEKAGEKPKPKYSQEELLAVFDEIIFSQEYTETYTIRNRLRVTFKTRTAEQVNAIQQEVDKSTANLITTMEQFRAMCNLRDAIVTYNDIEIGVMKSQDRMNFVRALPAAIVSTLITLHNRFEEKVALACEEGESNF